MHIRAFVVALFAFALGAAANIHAQTSLQVPQDLAGLQDPAWQNRSAAFYDLVGTSTGTQGIAAALVALLRADPADADAVRTGLIALLSRENGLANGGSSDLPETFTDYYADVIAAVASLQDSRAADALLGAIETGDMAGQGLAAIGAASLGKIVSLYSSSADPQQREAGIYALDAMIRNTPATDLGTLAAITNTLRRALRDSYQGVRVAALEGVSQLPADPAVLNLLASMAATDPYEAAQAGGAPGTFPVRDAAARALNTLRQVR